LRAQRQERPGRREPLIQGLAAACRPQVEGEAIVAGVVEHHLDGADGRAMYGEGRHAARADRHVLAPADSEAHHAQLIAEDRVEFTAHAVLKAPYMLVVRPEYRFGPGGALLQDPVDVLRHIPVTRWGVRAAVDRRLPD